MCGRYLVEIDDNELLDIIKAAENNSRSDSACPVFSGGEVFPGSYAPVVIPGGEPQFMVWGFPSLMPGKRPHINSRSETAASAKTFSEAMALRRCLVPASGYYEWKTIGKKHKEKYVFTMPDSGLMYMAGIFSIDKKFAILTRAAAPALLGIHDRMPVILTKALTSAWLAESPDAMRGSVSDLCFELVPDSHEQPQQLSLFV